jgi:D-alanyl-lipoteichoic acid acyltransferase DltB (MBOAT superfamily)
MLFNSYIFFIFLALVFTVFMALKKNHKARVLWILLASYVFYGYWEWKFLSLILISTFVDFFTGIKVEESDTKTGKKKWLMVSLITNLGILAYFKYANFFIDSFNDLFQQIGLNFYQPALNIVLPVGISFYTFQTMSYTIDVYRGKSRAERDFSNFALFVTFFPQLVAGPIERADHILKQFKEKFYPTKVQIQEGIHLIIFGLFKKVMIGDTLARIVDEIYTQPDAYNSLELTAAVILFGFQIYADFSGYSQIARGTSKLLGVELMKNFNQPYLSVTITDFWRRWHMSLSSWLRDYLYISLGGNRVGRTKLNLFLTMLLGGLWHGANWTFVVWGFLHGMYLSIHKFFMGLSIPMPKVLAWLITQFAVYYAWLYFRANSIADAFTIQKRILEFETSAEGWFLMQTSLVVGILLYAIDRFENKSGYDSAFRYHIKNPAVTYGILSAMAFISFLYMFQNKSLPFIYFQF